MTATTFDVYASDRSTSHVATALLSALDAGELAKREADLAEREAEVARRERQIAATERAYELQVLDGTALAAALGVDSTVTSPATQQPLRARFQEAFRLREHDWWTKVLGIAPTLP